MKQRDTLSVSGIIVLAILLLILGPFLIMGKIARRMQISLNKNWVFNSIEVFATVIAIAITAIRFFNKKTSQFISLIISLATFRRVVAEKKTT